MIAGKQSGWWRAVFGLTLIVAAPWRAAACAACFGRSDSPLAQGMNMGIFSLLVVIGAVLATLVTFFVHIGRRAARLREADGEEVASGSSTHS